MASKIVYPNNIIKMSKKDSENAEEKKEDRPNTRDKWVKKSLDDKEVVK